MNTNDILTDYANLFESLVSDEHMEACKNTIAISIRGQYTSLMLMCDAVTDEQRKAAGNLFQFYTMMSYAYSVLSSSIGAIRVAATVTVGSPIVFEIKDGDLFEKQHQALRESEELFDFQMKLTNEMHKDIDQKIKDLGNEVLGKMLNIVQPVEFEDTITE